MQKHSELGQNIANVYTTFSALNLVLACLLLLDLTCHDQRTDIPEADLISLN